MIRKSQTEVQFLRPPTAGLNGKIMRLTKVKKERLFELLDVMTDRCPNMGITQFENSKDNAIFWSIFKKLRLELKGF